MEEGVVKGRSARELLGDYLDAEWRSRFVQICDLVDILEDCVIDRSYSIPDDLNNSIVLSEAGIAMKGRLIRKEKVPPKEAHLMVALTLGYTELYLDVAATNIEKMAEAISEQVLSQEIRFPLRYGREFYDAYAELFDDEKDVLTSDETVRILDKVSIGVFQYGHLVLGPFGLQPSSTARRIRFSKRVPAYHCAQPVCKTVHPVRLVTSQEALINEQYEKLRRILESEPSTESDWDGLADEIRDMKASLYSDQLSGTLIAVLGDCLSDRELFELAVELMNSTAGSLRARTAQFLSIKNAEEDLAGLTRGQLLQICLICDEETIKSAVDRMIMRGDIHINRGEIRRPVVNKEVRSGAFQLAPEIGALGVRFVSNDPGFAFLREKRLLNKLYVRTSDTDTEELDWQLRGFEAEDVDERLEDFFLSTDPRAALTRMILARKTNMVTACHEVGIESGSEFDDAKLVETVLWKLGFDVHYEEDPHSYFWDLHQRISALTQSSRISGIGESETFRGVASTYFSELEGLLVDALAFGSWVLLSDHTTSRYPFSYDDAENRRQGLTELQAAFVNSSDTHSSFDYTSDRVELEGLFRGFAILADALQEHLDSGNASLRPLDELPDYVGKTDLKTFLFRSRIPFLNVTSASRVRIIEGLRSISAAAARDNVSQVRNDYSHYRRTSPEVDRMAKALQAVAVAVQEIENLGIARVLCWPVSSSSDAWGRSRYTFRGPRSVEHLFARPSNFDWMGLPSLTEPQYLIRAASISEPNEIMRFTRRFHSEFSQMWDDYPKPRKPSGDERSAPTDAPSQTDEIELSTQ